MPRYLAPWLLHLPLFPVTRHLPARFIAQPFRFMGNPVQCFGERQLDKADR